MRFTPELFLQELELYGETWASGTSLDAAEQRKVLETFTEFTKNEPGCFERTTISGHITGSAVIVNEDMKQILLTHHRKLNEWLQLGGHADGDPMPSRVALREGEEESGLKDLQFVSYGSVFGKPETSSLLLDLDVHWIPPHKNDAGHYHYDARYLLSTKNGAAIQITEESKDLKWFPLEAAYAMTKQWSMHRLFDKVNYVRERLKC